MTSSHRPMSPYRDVPQKQCVTPAFEFDPGDLHETEVGTLPSIWVTVPRYDSTDEEGSLEREHIDLWPQSVGCDLGDDPGADMSDEPLAYGSWFYNEAMRYQAPDEHDLRIEAFQSAEVLYLWAAAAGSVQAVCNLGYVYSYDRCENHYWARTLRIIRGDDTAYDWVCPREEWAYACYRYAAEKDNDEACYKLGDLQKQGRGCERDEAAAFASYQRAYELSKTWDNGSWGPPALRLATCYEEGVGCEPDFAQARHWYGIARAGLSIMVNGGAWFYKRSLNQAEAGARRMDQELAG